MAAVFCGKSFTFILFELLLVVFLTECCVKNSSVVVTPEERAARSDYILHGTVKEKITPDPRTPKILTSYGIKFQVKCVYKGDPTSERLKQEIITIAGAGVVDPSCYSLNVDVGEDYTLFLNDESSHVVPSYGAPTDVQDVYELIIICDLYPKAPGGAPAPSADCPKSDPVDCVRYKFPESTTKAKATTIQPNKIVTLKPVVEPEPEPEPKTTDKETVNAADKEQLETKDNGKGGAASISSVTSIISIFICLFSALYLS